MTLYNKDFPKKQLSNRKTEKVQVSDVAVSVNQRTRNSHIHHIQTISDAMVRFLSIFTLPVITNVSFLVSMWNMWVCYQ